MRLHKITIKDLLKRTPKLSAIIHNLAFKNTRKPPKLTHQLSFLFLVYVSLGLGLVLRIEPKANWTSH